MAIITQQPFTEGEKLKHCSHKTKSLFCVQGHKLGNIIHLFCFTVPTGITEKTVAAEMLEGLNALFHNKVINRQMSA